MQADDRTAQERADDTAFELTAVVIEFMLAHGLVASVSWDGAELLVGWAEGEGDDL